jgi:hypothetical protein
MQASFACIVHSPASFKRHAFDEGQMKDPSTRSISRTIFFFILLRPNEPNASSRWLPSFLFQQFGRQQMNRFRPR